MLLLTAELWLSEEGNNVVVVVGVTISCGDCNGGGIITILKWSFHDAAKTLAASGNLGISSGCNGFKTYGKLGSFKLRT